MVLKLTSVFILLVVSFSGNYAYPSQPDNRMFTPAGVPFWVSIMKFSFQGFMKKRLLIISLTYNLLIFLIELCLYTQKVQALNIKFSIHFLRV